MQDGGELRDLAVHSGGGTGQRACEPSVEQLALHLALGQRAGELPHAIDVVPVVARVVARQRDLDELHGGGDDGAVGGARDRGKGGEPRAVG